VKLLVLYQYKAFILIATAVLALLIASPVLQQAIVYPQTDRLTELSLFGQYHNATYPYNITNGGTYPLYLDISNHLGSAAYYDVEVKFRNATQSGADSFNQTSSGQPPLGKLTCFAANEQTADLPFQVAFHYSVNKPLQIKLTSITINGYTVDASSTTIDWDMQRGGYFGNLFFELWLYNGATGSFQYNQRYVSLWFNLTV
jgi:hypothetical protein